MHEHLTGCAHCAELFGNGAQLGRRLAFASPPAVDDLPRQLVATEALIAREHGLRAFLRSRSTNARWALSFVLPGALLAREWLKHAPARELSTAHALAALLLLVLLGLVVRNALRPLPLDRFSARLYSLFALVAWSLPCVFWFSAEARVGGEEFSGGDFALRSLSCFGYGSACAVPSFALLWAFDRGERLSYRVWALAAGLVAALSSLILLVHCPDTQRAHLLAGHFSIGLVWFAALSTASFWQSRAN